MPYLPPRGEEIEGTTSLSVGLCVQEGGEIVSLQESTLTAEILELRYNPDGRAISMKANIAWDRTDDKKTLTFLIDLTTSVGIAEIK